MSSLSNRNSKNNTPETKLTQYSPLDMKPAQRTTPRPVKAPLREGQDDPFVSDEPKPETHPRLSATALDFKPNLPATKSASSDSAVMEKTVQFLQEQTEEASKIAHFGSFTTNTSTSRCIKVSSFNGGDTYKLVMASFDKLDAKHEGRYRRPRVNEIGNVLYLRFGNITEAVETFDAIKADNPRSLRTDYVSVTLWGGVVTPRESGYSEHEGQVVLQVSNPPGMLRSEFEEWLLCQLATFGPLAAWQVVSRPDSLLYTLLVEYYDCSLASHAVEALNGKVIGIDKNGHELKIALIHYRPCHGVMSTYLGAVPANAQATPTRRSSEKSGSDDDDDDDDDDESISSLSRTHRRSGPRGSTSLPSTSSVLSVDTLGQLGNALGFMAFHDRTPSSTFSPGPGNNMGASSLSPFGASNTSGTGQFGLPVPMSLATMYSPTTPSAQIIGTGQFHSQFSHFGNFAQPHTPNPYAHFGQAIHSPESIYSMSPSSLPRHEARDFGHLSPSPGMFPRELGRYNSGFARRQNAQKVPNTTRNKHNPAASQHNHVDITSIQLGKDVRTTVMLRNIPNKIDQPMLKILVDESSRGRYDFMYLRIDFANNCNVGYAFINFVDPLDIIDFVRARADQKWYKFQSEKVAQVSYATIQGRDCLIQKFRNSSVMLEAEHYRPKLYYTLDDGEALAGREEPFPSSDNSSKLQRSCQNAEQMGLFAPSAGQQVRADQRGRRSQYDRGTSLAEMDEFNFDAFNNRGFSGYGSSY